MRAQYLDTLEIRDLIENWVIWRDAGDWERFATVWHSKGFMTATWFEGSASEFIAASRRGFESGARILHFLGGTSVEVDDQRAVAQTKMTISQRSYVHQVAVDVVCTGRFFDFFAIEDERWRLVRRQPIYEMDRMDPVEPDAKVALDIGQLKRFPEGYRHLAYLQEGAGFTVKNGLPGLTGGSVNRLYAQGAAWLAGADSAGALE
ncbi:nuclear transport factor 2 family protein [Amycolatopsis sp. H20-H5]|uniref:nuclear transport factor 2 family protein n=1 Tax=Amycolatopsis sp. H20-H5 TaxID=3046309 RepID=UPI002DBACAC5|nr:nuclear transport factor 2 family protein [Amycolatopsis sp. H20-H5]MEC3974449.1 nuclear transport factor 2 family protein [Amycolatopsis sp. H20-H5]